MSERLSKLRGWLGIWLTALVFFGIAAGLFFLAYAGMESGTALKTAANPFRHNRAPPVYAGVYTREKNPGIFWMNEIAYSAAGILFTACGVRILWEEYKQRQQRQKSPATSDVEL